MTLAVIVFCAAVLWAGARAFLALRLPARPLTGWQGPGIGPREPGSHWTIVTEDEDDAP